MSESPISSDASRQPYFVTTRWSVVLAAQDKSSLDSVEAEHRFAAEPPLTPDDLYERRWALTLLNKSLDRLQREFSHMGKEQEFNTLKDWLTAERGHIPYDQIATVLGSSEGTARVAVHRMRKQFRALFRQTIAEAVDVVDDVDAEMRYLVSILSRA